MTQRAGAAMLPSALLLLCVPGEQGRSWVQGGLLWRVRHEMVETRGPEGAVRSDQVVITDHPGDLTFTVTLENLTADDAGKYRCGIATILQEESLSGFLPDPFFQVQVLVSSGPCPATPNSCFSHS
uniref:Ig-like domain-containing protein n=1 Tax=Nomascus leucogenys TaxID=61853 RepID=A0A2I3HSA0_NOMLE